MEVKVDTGSVVYYQQVLNFDCPQQCCSNRQAAGRGRCGKCPCDETWRNWDVT